MDLSEMLCRSKMGQTFSGLFSVNKEIDKKDKNPEEIKPLKTPKKTKPKLKKENPLLIPILQRATN